MQIAYICADKFGFYSKQRDVSATTTYGFIYRIPFFCKGSSSIMRTVNLCTAKETLGYIVTRFGVFSDLTTNKQKKIKFSLEMSHVSCSHEESKYTERNFLT